MSEYAYQIIEDADRREVARLVVLAYAKGFRCVGGVATETVAGTTFFSQAMERVPSTFGGDEGAL